MLVLSRKLNQEIIVGDDIKITVLKLKGNTVRLGIEAPREVRVVRGELPPEPDERQIANVTVVFNDTLERHGEKPRHVLESRTGDSATEIIPFQTSRQETTCSISYKERLPQMLEHNRLQQIVSELTRKK